MDKHFFFGCCLNSNVSHCQKRQNRAPNVRSFCNYTSFLTRTKSQSLRLFIESKKNLQLQLNLFCCSMHRFVDIFK